MPKNKIPSPFLFFIIAAISLFGPGLSPGFSSFRSTFIFIFFSGIILLCSYFIYRGKNLGVFIPSLFFAFLYFSLPLIFLQTKITRLSFPGVLFILPISLYIFIVFTHKDIRKKVTWMKIGRIDSLSLILILVMVGFSAIALIGWTFILKPDLRHITSWIPDWPSGILVLGGIGFALTNALAEELIYRGILWDGLKSIFRNLSIIIILQALLFGLWHFDGFPGGIVGMTLVFIWGLFLGIIRYRTRGLLAPILSHFFADLTIFGILFYMLRF